jgi:hypothetical protein
MNDLFPEHDWGRTVWTLDADGNARKRDGLNRVEQSADDWLAWVRAEAVRISVERGEVSADDLRIVTEQAGRHPHHVNAWGAVFRGDEWELVGRRTSATPTAHAREIKVWRYKQQGAVL